MVSTVLSKHANARCQQRGVPQWAVNMIVEHGRCTYDHRGARIWFLDNRARDHVRRACSVVDGRWKKLMNVYVVTVGDVAVTVGHRYKRIWRQ